VRAVAKALNGCQRRGDVPVLLACQWDDSPDGHLAIAAINSSVAENVKLNDLVVAGFAAVRNSSGQLAVMPRIYRKTCDNGEVTQEVEGPNLLDHENDDEEIVSRIQRCMDGVVFAGTVRGLQRTTQITVDDPIEVLLEARVVTPLEEAIREFVNQDDRTGWGLINAVTATARRVENFARRVEREADAARIMAVLHARVGHARTVAVRRVPPPHRRTRQPTPW
ncbi:MAG: hypothetical protein V3U11_04040, partial [Planctomycetota bacterium]